jgi:hypothetical protein
MMENLIFSAIPNLGEILASLNITTPRPLIMNISAIPATRKAGVQFNNDQTTSSKTNGTKFKSLNSFMSENLTMVVGVNSITSRPEGTVSLGSSRR